jgi:hypothetical protein
MVALFDIGEVMSLWHIIVSWLLSRYSGIQLHCYCFWQQYILSCCYIGLLQQGSDSVQGARPQIMLQAMNRITRWLAQGTKTEGVVKWAVRRSFIGKFQHNIC